MAKKPAAAAASEGTAPARTKTFPLATPIADDAGNMVTEVTLKEPELRHRVQAERGAAEAGLIQTGHFIAALSGLSEKTARRLKIRDLQRMSRWIETQKRRGLIADAMLEAGAESAPLEPTRTFTLLVPIETNAAPVTEITVREPDLEAAIAVDRFKTEAERTAALIAALSGQTIPIVMRMKLADSARVERWLDFFSEAGEISPADAEETNATTSTATSEAGATSP